MATKRLKSARPKRTRKLKDGADTVNPHPSIVPPMEATATACADNVFAAINQVKQGDELGAVTSGVAAGAFLLGFVASSLQIVYNSRNRSGL
ncbi:hypothetical protein [Pseudanabaena sp. 'Roaring Creek']|uniref:hypothetical protein n=1 Tax=Pseudanabaena sp. 'Roaring Creek' TaxID=1681830 RepID=UPI0012E11947|nr:hypothetical protein [Pseudanabaena sp. 'Roaring Creek']